MSADPGKGAQDGLRRTSLAWRRSHPHPHAHPRWRRPALTAPTHHAMEPDPVQPPIACESQPEEPNKLEDAVLKFLKQHGRRLVWGASVATCFLVAAITLRHHRRRKGRQRRCAVKRQGRKDARAVLRVHLRSTFQQWPCFAPCSAGLTIQTLGMTKCASHCVKSSASRRGSGSRKKCRCESRVAGRFGRALQQNSPTHALHVCVSTYTMQAARDGDANSMLRLSQMFLNGRGCKQNLPMAIEWLRRARYTDALTQTHTHTYTRKQASGYQCRIERPEWVLWCTCVCTCVAAGKAAYTPRLMRYGVAPQKSWSGSAKTHAEKWPSGGPHLSRDRPCRWRPCSTHMPLTALRCDI